MIAEYGISFFSASLARDIMCCRYLIFSAECVLFTFHTSFSTLG